MPVSVSSVLSVARWAALVGYVAFVIVSAVSNYFDMVALVEGTLQKAVQAERWELLRQAHAPEGERAEEVRDAILRGAERSGLVVDERKVVVSQAGGALRVSLNWTYQVVAIRGETIIGIPLVLDRSFDLR